MKLKCGVCGLVDEPWGVGVQWIETERAYPGSEEKVATHKQGGVDLCSEFCGARYLKAHPLGIVRQKIEGAARGAVVEQTAPAAHPPAEATARTQVPGPETRPAGSQGAAGSLREEPQHPSGTGAPNHVGLSIGSSMSAAGIGSQKPGS